jgi:ribosomal protein S18 acetylase RimI-like enzyme
MKQRIIDILFESFYINGSVTWVVKQDRFKDRRLRLLLAYSYFCGEAFGKIYLNASEDAAAILIYSEKKKTTVRSVLWEIRLLIGTIGRTNIFRILKREAALKRCHPTGPFVHLWYIGVDPVAQHQGRGTELLRKVLKGHPHRKFHLETSISSNIPWYESNGFRVVAQLDEVGYPLTVMHRI